MSCIQGGFLITADDSCSNQTVGGALPASHVATGAALQAADGHGGVTGAIQKLTVAQRRARDTRDLVQQYSRAYQIREADDRSKWLGTIIPLPDVDKHIIFLEDEPDDIDFNAGDILALGSRTQLPQHNLAFVKALKNRGDCGVVENHKPAIVFGVDMQCMNKDLDEQDLSLWKRKFDEHSLEECIARPTLLASFQEFIDTFPSHEIFPLGSSPVCLIKIRIDIENKRSDFLYGLCDPENFQALNERDLRIYEDGQVMCDGRMSRDTPVLHLIMDSYRGDNLRQDDSISRVHENNNIVCFTKSTLSWRSKSWQSSNQMRYKDEGRFAGLIDAYKAWISGQDVRAGNVSHDYFMHMRMETAFGML
jgi:hypothetical protein